MPSPNRLFVVAWLFAPNRLPSNDPTCSTAPARDGLHEAELAAIRSAAVDPLLVTFAHAAAGRGSTSGDARQLSAFRQAGDPYRQVQRQPRPTLPTSRPA